ncbi:MAG: DUF3863 domain-containing protein [Planctomycetota bacterium]
MTWAFSWHALQDKRENYKTIRKMITEYCEKHGDEITFIPGGFFANMYNTNEQVNRDLHDGLAMVSDMVGSNYRPKSVVAGFLSAENLKYLAEHEKIHVCQGNIWSQYAVDNGDGEGSVCYPFKDNSGINYRFIQQGTGIHGSDENLEIFWLMNKEFRLALMRECKPEETRNDSARTSNPEKYWRNENVIDFRLKSRRTERHVP